jgi:hypothetical protein
LSEGWQNWFGEPTPMFRLSLLLSNVLLTRMFSFCHPTVKFDPKLYLAHEHPPRSKTHFQAPFEFFKRNRKTFQTNNKIEVRIGCEYGAVVSERDGCDCEVGQW